MTEKDGPPGWHQRYVAICHGSFAPETTSIPRTKENGMRIALILIAIATASLMPMSIADAKLQYPGDCDSKTLQRAASKNGCSVEAGGNHFTVKKNGKVITQIPRAMKDNGTCRGIIKVLNDECGA